MPVRERCCLYGFHDPGGEQLMIDAGKPGWVLVSEEIGHNPRSRRGKSYQDLADKGIKVIVRLNNGHRPDGTIPLPDQYDDFARRCAFFSKNSTGCRAWIVGNEMNHPQERPGITPQNPHGEPITPDLYAQAYLKCRRAIHEVAGKEHQVILGAVAPYNAETRYPGNETGDWVLYLRDLLERVGDECDGIALHAYTWGPDPELIASEERMEAPYEHRRKQFRAYRDFMEAIPQSQRHLPVYITEANQGAAGVPWRDIQNGWIGRAYAEIDEWNRQGGQQIRCLLLHRWSEADPWSISNQPNLIADFKVALAHDDCRGDEDAEPRDSAEDVWAEIAELREQVSSLTGRVAGLEEQMARLLVPTPPVLQSPRVSKSSGVPKPPIRYIVEGLRRHPTDRYSTRSLDQITHIVIHHSATRDTITAEQMARYHVNELGWPGIGYHFVIAADGTIWQTNELTSISYHTRQANRYSVGVCFVGDFKDEPPSEAQLNSGGHLIAWLLQELSISLENVGGHKKHVLSTSCPGDQWDAGQQWGELLRKRIEEYRT